MRSLRFCLLLTLCCAGCVLTYSVSNQKGFRPYIGRAVILNRPMLLVGLHSVWFRSRGILTMGYARYALTEPESAWAPGPLYATLPVKYPAIIDSVHKEITGDNAIDVVYGHIVNPTNGERGSFAYVHYASDPLPWRLAAPNE